MAVEDKDSEMSDLEYSDYEDLVSDEEDSDYELQDAFEKGLLKPGLNLTAEQVAKEKTNDVAGLEQKLNSFKQQLPWIERMDITNTPAALAPELDVEIAEHANVRERRMKNVLKNFKIEEDPVHNDFKREMTFYRQAQQAVMDGFERLTKMNLPTVRPEDYFAEMAKSDEHMHKIRERLMKKKAGQEMSEKVRQIRELKKLGKKVHIEAQQKKQKEKREMLEKVKQFREGKTDSIDFLSDKPLREKDEKKMRLAKRRSKDRKYGHGGKKRNKKRNDGKDLDRPPRSVRTLKYKVNKKTGQPLMASRKGAKGKGGGGGGGKGKGAKGKGGGKNKRKGNLY